MLTLLMTAGWLPRSSTVQRCRVSWLILSKQLRVTTGRARTTASRLRYKSVVNISFHYIALSNNHGMEIFIIFAPDDPAMLIQNVRDPLIIYPYSHIMYPTILQLADE